MSRQKDKWRHRLTRDQARRRLEKRAPLHRWYLVDDQPQYWDDVSERAHLLLLEDKEEANALSAYLSESGAPHFESHSEAEIWIQGEAWRLKALRARGDLG